MATVMSLNLHGYHPMNEERRVTIHLDGKSEITDSRLFYFSEPEILRGLNARQNQLAQDISRIQPDLIFLQEVGGGKNLASAKNCNDFEAFNTASDLKRRLNQPYLVHLACRGNVGWWTDSETFRGFNVYSEKNFQRIVGPGSNPYPNGMLIEGLAILTSPKIIVLQNQSGWIPYGSSGKQFFLQWIKFKLRHDSQNRFYLALNIHGKWDIEHFESAVATRITITNTLAKDPERNQFGGMIVAGDFNAYTADLEPNTIPWAGSSKSGEQIKKSILAFNSRLRNPRNPDDVSRSVNQALLQYENWKHQPRLPQDDHLQEITSRGNCNFKHRELNPICTVPQKIDHIFVSPSLKARSYSLLYQQNNWIDLKNTLSDHPAVYAEISF